MYKNCYTLLCMFIAIMTVQTDEKFRIYCCAARDSSFKAINITDTVVQRRSAASANSNDTINCREICFRQNKWPSSRLLTSCRINHGVCATDKWTQDTATAAATDPSVFLVVCESCIMENCVFFVTAGQYVILHDVPA